jgi:hypothetical protein
MVTLPERKFHSFVQLLHSLSYSNINEKISFFVCEKKDTVEIGSQIKVDICIRVWSPFAWKLFEIYRTLLLLLIPCIIIFVSYCLICIGKVILIIFFIIFYLLNSFFL